MSLKYVQTNTLYLSGSGTIVGATTVSLTTFTDIYGNVLTMADFGAKGYITLEPDTTNEEAATFTGVTANTNGTYTLTGVETTLARSPYTETNGLVRQHSGGTKVVVTDNVAFWNTFANKNNDETIQGSWTFVNAPASLSATPASTTQLGNVKLTVAPSKSIGTATITIASPAVVTVTAHGLIAGDTVQFTTTGALPTGITTNTTYFVIATGLTTNTFEVAATAGGTAINTTGTQSGTHTAFKVTPTAVTSNDPSIFPNAYGVDTGTANTYAITLPTAPTALVAGQLYAFLVTNGNTGASTLNVNGLGAKAIVRPNGAAVQGGDIVSGQTLLVLYDGTSFRIDGIPSTVKFGGTGADGALNVTTGTTTINLGSAAVVIKNYSSINISNGATVNFSNPNAAGTVVIFKSQGAITIAGTLDDSGIGGAGGASASASGANNGNNGTTTLSYSASVAPPNVGNAGASNGTAGAASNPSAAGINSSYYSTVTNSSFLKYTAIVVSTGGGSGGSRFNSSPGSGATGAGGNGGGTLIIECGGAWNFQGTISVAGLNGGNGTASGGQQSSAGGGGGGGGLLLVLYSSLTANTGTVNVSGGTGGNSVITTNVPSAAGASGGASFANGGGAGSVVSSGQGGGNGGNGTSLIIANTDFI